MIWRQHTSLSSLVSNALSLNMKLFSSNESKKVTFSEGRFSESLLVEFETSCSILRSLKLSPRGRSSLYTGEAASTSMWRQHGLSRKLGRRTHQGQEEPARSCKQFRIIWTFVSDASRWLEAMLLCHGASTTQRCGLGATEKKSLFFFHVGIPKVKAISLEFKMHHN